MFNDFNKNTMGEVMDLGQVYYPSSIQYILTEPVQAVHGIRFTQN